MSDLRFQSNIVSPKTIEDLSQFLRDTNMPVIFGAGLGRGGSETVARTLLKERAKRHVSILKNRSELDEFEETKALLQEADAEVLAGFKRLDLHHFSGIKDYSPKDLVVKVGVDTFIDVEILDEGDGTTTTFELGQLQHALMEQAQCIPFARPIKNPGFDFELNQSSGTVGLGVALNRPHPLQSQCGSWRDWVLGMTMVLADGSIVRAGSNVVKNVAGFDAHKLMVGARDTFAVVVDVTLRTFPLDALPEPDIVIGPAWKNETLRKMVIPYELIQRVKPVDFSDAVNSAGDNLLFADSASSTIWCWLTGPDQDLPRYPGDWVIRTGCGAKNISITDSTQIALMKRAKAIFDPTNKLNPGEFGFL